MGILLLAICYLVWGWICRCFLFREGGKGKNEDGDEDEDEEKGFGERVKRNLRHGDTWM